MLANTLLEVLLRMHQKTKSQIIIIVQINTMYKTIMCLNIIYMIEWYWTECTSFMYHCHALHLKVF